jgi:eukaryotic-like serine/threonine-protein kinase
MVQCHGQGVVHRDIKPANIMVDSATETVKVTDFGIARVTDSSRTRTGVVMGTPSFMAPEQLAGQRVDGRADLYALGVTLFQLLTGRLPFQGESLAALMFRIANEPPASLAPLRPDLPVELGHCLARAMAKHPAERFQTGAQLAAELRRIGPFLPADDRRQVAGLNENTLPLTVLTAGPDADPDRVDLRL